MSRLVPKVGFEPTRGCPQRCLRPSRLPFRHFGSRRNPSGAARGPGTRAAVTASMRGTSRRIVSGRASPAGPDARLAAPHHRRPEGRARSWRTSARPRPSTTPIQRRDLILLEQARDGDLDAFNDLVELLPGPAVRARRAHGPRSRPGARRRPGGVLLGVPQPALVPWRERPVVAEPDRDQRGDGPRSAPRSAGPSSPTRSSTTRAGSRRPARRPTRSGRRCTASGRACWRRRSRRSPTTSGTRSSCSTSRATTTPRSPSMTGVSLGTVKSRIHRGRLALRDRLEGSIGLFRGEDG